jgi:hypothetical protein
MMRVMRVAGEILTNYPLANLKPSASRDLVFACIANGTSRPRLLANNASRVAVVGASSSTFSPICRLQIYFSWSAKESRR